MLKPGHSLRQFGCKRIRDGADLGILQCHGVAEMVAIGKAIQADQIAGHVKTADPLMPFRQGQARLQVSASHLIKVLEQIALTVQRFAGPDPSPAERPSIRAEDFTAREFAGQASFAEMTARAKRQFRRQFDRLDVLACRLAARRTDAGEGRGDG